MDNAKYLGCMCGLAVALGVGLAVAGTPAVASADPPKGSSPGESSQSSDPPSGKKAASSTTNDAPKPHRRAPKPHAEAEATSSSGAGPSTERVRKRGTIETGTSKKSASPPVTTLSAVPVRSAVATPSIAPPSRTPNPTDPVSRIVSSLMGVARREFAPVAAADPDFITSTHGFFGLFSVTSAADPDDNHYVAFVLRTPFFTNVLTSGTDPEDSLGFGPASIGVAGHTVNTFISPFLNFSVGVPIEDPFAPLFTALVAAGF
jgi:hypothetical protein